MKLNGVYSAFKRTTLQLHQGYIYMGDFQLLGFTLARRINNCDNFRFSKILNGKKNYDAKCVS